jgi:Glycosyltransferase family 87
VTARGLVRAVRRRPEQAIIAVLASVAAVAILAYAADPVNGLHKLNDFYGEAAPSYVALMHGHVLGFLRLAPPYGGSLVLRAPFAMLPALWGGGLRAVYFASALPCMLAAAAFAVWIAAQPRRHGAPWPPRIVAICCAVVNPVIMIVLLGGHPEEVLGAVLCVAAVMLASGGRAEWAGLLVGLAVANKPWALVAVPVVVATLPQRRWRALAIAAASAALVLVPLAATRQHGLSAAANGADVGSLFNAPQLLWWFGHGSWIVREARLAIVIVAVLLTALWCLVRRHEAVPARASRVPDGLVLLALVLLLRAALDPQNNIWYHLPFLFALLAFEVRSGRTPLLMGTYTIAFIVVVPVVGGVVTRDVQAAIYAALVLPMIAWLAARLYLPSGALGRLRARRRIPARLRPDPASLA